MKDNEIRSDNLIVRISPSEKASLLERMRRHGFANMSAFIRQAILNSDQKNPTAAQAVVRAAQIAMSSFEEIEASIHDITYKKDAVQRIHQEKKDFTNQIRRQIKDLLMSGAGGR